MVEQKIKLNVFEMKKATLNNPARQANLRIRNVIGKKYGVEFTSLKEAKDMSILDVIKSEVDAETLAVQGKLFTVKQAREHSLIKDEI